MRYTRLYIGGISSWTEPRDLEDVFRKYGRLSDFHFKGDYAFVEFRSGRDAEDAQRDLDSYRMDGRRLIVEYAREQRRRGSRSGQFSYRGRDRRRSRSHRRGRTPPGEG